MPNLNRRASQGWAAFTDGGSYSGVSLGVRQITCTAFVGPPRAMFLEVPPAERVTTRVAAVPDRNRHTPRGLGKCAGREPSLLMLPAQR
jgi:hypothetical protein